MLTKLILLIDDEPNLAQVIVVCLESFKKGWQVRVANSGKEGLKIVEAVNPDAILLDVMMPEMDGITVFSHLQQNPNRPTKPTTTKPRHIKPNQPNQSSN